MASDPLILVSNDDGMWAPGIKTLVRVAQSYGETFTVAPHVERSGASQMISVHTPLRVQQIEEKRFAIEGYPADCIKLALNSLMPKTPDLVLTGINRGANLGQDTLYSGTIGAALEAALHGIPAIAFSTDGKTPLSYAAAEKTVHWVLNQRETFTLPGKVININVPSLPTEEIKGYKLTHLGRRFYGDAIACHRDPGGKPYFWIGGEQVKNDGGDCIAFQKGWVTITVLEPKLFDRSGQDELSHRMHGIAFPDGEANL